MKTEEQLRTELYERLRDLFPMSNDERNMIEGWRFVKQRKYLACLGENFSLKDIQETVRKVEEYGYTNLEFSDADMSIYAVLDEWHDNEVESASDNIRRRINWLRPLVKRVP